MGICFFHDDIPDDNFDTKMELWLFDIQDSSILNIQHPSWKITRKLLDLMGFNGKFQDFDEIEIG